MADLYTAETGREDAREDVRVSMRRPIMGPSSSGVCDSDEVDGHDEVLSDDDDDAVDDEADCAETDVSSALEVDECE